MKTSLLACEPATREIKIIVMSQPSTLKTRFLVLNKRSCPSQKQTKQTNKPKQTKNKKICLTVLPRRISFWDSAFAQGQDMNPTLSTSDLGWLSSTFGWSDPGNPAWRNGLKLFSWASVPNAAVQSLHKARSEGELHIHS